MAIVQETYSLNGRRYVRTYSNAGRYVIGGSPEGAYTEANDPAEFDRTYIEGDLIPKEEQPEETTPAWDITQGEYIPVGYIVTRDGVTYECIQAHYAAWSKQPPNETYWKEV